MYMGVDHYIILISIIKIVYYCFYIAGFRCVYIRNLNLHQFCDKYGASMSDNPVPGKLQRKDFTGKSTNTPQAIFKQKRLAPSVVSSLAAKKAKRSTINLKPHEVIEEVPLCRRMLVYEESSFPLGVSSKVQSGTESADNSLVKKSALTRNYNADRVLNKHASAKLLDVAVAVASGTSSGSKPVLSEHKHINKPMSKNLEENLDRLFNQDKLFHKEVRYSVFIENALHFYKEDGYSCVTSQEKNSLHQKACSFYRKKRAKLKLQLKNN